MRKIIIILFLNTIGCIFANAQVSTSGTITDELGQPIPGVNILERETNNGVVSDFNGHYTIEVPSNATLIFSSVGFKITEIAVNGRKTIDVILPEELSALDEIVIVGYGTQKKINLTGSVESINGDKISKQPVLQASSALVGLVSGVTVDQNSGRPGGDGASIRIRGIGTLGDSNPLVLIDGVQGSLDGVNPNDIENISVLKDAAASAIYGSRAANGVILVTTKRGKLQELKFNYNGYTGFQEFTKLPSYVDGYTYMTNFNQARLNVGQSAIYSDTYLQEYQANKSTNPDKYPDVNWIDEATKSVGYQQQHTFSVSGGAGKITSAASMSYMSQDGLIDNYDFKRVNLRANNDLKVNDWMKIRFDVSGSISHTEQPVGGNDVLTSIFRTPAINAGYLSNGHLAAGELGGGNILGDIHDRGFDKTEHNTFRGTFGFELTPVKGLNVKILYSPEYGQNFQKVFEKTYDLYRPDEVEVAYSVPNFSSLNESMSRRWENTFQATATYNTTLGKSNFTILGGIESYDFRTDNLSGFRRDFIFTDYPELSSGGVDNQNTGGNAAHWALLSYFGRFNYSFNEKYLFEANLRYDGSSRFSKANQWGTFPSFSTGWRVSKEDFLKNVDWLSNLKLRASWGQLGNQFVPGGYYPFVSTVALGSSFNYAFGGIPVTGAAITSLANTALTWETAESTNYGIDFGFFNQQLSGSFEYYVRETKDILLNLQVPNIIGLSAPPQNAGVVENKGWDFSLRYKGGSGDFTYNIGGNISDVSNEIVDLKGTGPYIGSYTIREVGQPIDALFGYKSDGLFQTQAEVDGHATQFGTYGPGDIKYVDQLTEDTDADGIPDTADGKINADDRVVLGNNFPRYSYAFDINMNVKNFDIGLQFNGVGKRQVYLQQNAVWAFFNGGSMQKWQLDNWTPENTDASFPKLAFGTSHNNFNVSDYWTFNAAYLRLRNAQIGYTIPKEALKKSFFDNIRLYVSGTNLFTINHMPEGWDPTRPNGATSYYPITSTYVFGLNIGF